MERSKILMIFGGLIGVLLFLGVAYMLTSQPQETSFPQLTEVKANDHTKWSDQNKIILTEYSDFQCPACASYAALVQGLTVDEEFKKTIEPNVTFVYRHFPLDSIHPNARAGAYAAEAAAKQGKFYEMHDVLFAKQEEWSESGSPEEVFITYATELELDIEQFQADYGSSEVKDRVQSDYQSGLDVNVQGTPSFYLNGKKINNPRSVEDFKQLLLTEIQSASK